MRIRTILMAALLLGSTSAYAMDAKAAFARLKTLVGAWETDTDMGKVNVSYELIAGGTTLLERESGEKLPVMITLYHLDGDRLLLTHYCMAGNQPRMQARRFDSTTGELRFEFLDATNLTDGAGHMRNATMRFVDNDRLHAAWEYYEKGQLKSTESWQYKRVR